MASCLYDEEELSLIDELLGKDSGAQGNSKPEECEEGEAKRPRTPVRPRSGASHAVHPLFLPTGGDGLNTDGGSAACERSEASVEARLGGPETEESGHLGPEERRALKPQAAADMISPSSSSRILSLVSGLVGGRRKSEKVHIAADTGDVSPE